MKKGLLALPVLFFLALVVLIGALGSATSQAQCDSGGGGTAPGGIGGLKVNGIPAAYVAMVRKAGTVCPEFPAPIIAAQIQQESGWNPHAQSPVGAMGLTQFMPATWASSGIDGDGDGKADPQNPADAIASQAHYDCGLAKQIRGWISDGSLHTTASVTEMALGAYNAGPGAVLAASGVPQNAETAGYVPRIMSMAKTQFSDAGKSGSSVDGAGNSAGLQCGADSGGPVSAGAAKPVLAAAKRWIGMPYAWGGGGIAGPSLGFGPDEGITGFDCSSFVQNAYAVGTRNAITLPRVAQDQYNATATHAVPGGFRPDTWKPGDLIFYGTADNIHHVAMVWGNGQLIQAPESGEKIGIKPIYKADWFATTRPLAGRTHS